MLQIVLASFLVWGFFRIKEKDGVIDGFSALSLVLAPALLVFLISLAINFLNLSVVFAYLAESLYFIIPFFLIKGMSEYSVKRSATYACIVFMCVIASQIPFYLLTQPPA